VNRRTRIALFGLSAAGVGALLLWGLAGLPSFGDYAGPYGDLIANLAPPQRHIANAVTAVVFDYRGFDTMGEELILFGAASAVAMLLRETREHDVADIVDRVRSDATNAISLLAALAALTVGLDVVAHGLLTPGGGFQGGVVLAAAFLVLFLGVEFHVYNHFTAPTLGEPVESFGAGGYIGLGLVSLGLGLSFLQNFMGIGTFGRLTSGGSVLLVSFSSGIAVAGGFMVIFNEFLQENMAARYGR
jgi:multicomponent Na+:H+ antiporter subunit B